MNIDKIAMKQAKDGISNNYNIFRVITLAQKLSKEKWLKTWDEFQKHWGSKIDYTEDFVFFNGCLNCGYPKTGKICPVCGNSIVMKQPMFRKEKELGL